MMGDDGKSGSRQVGATAMSVLRNVALSPSAKRGTLRTLGSRQSGPEFLRPR